jgi:peptidoglycan/LPS O-acetylase OafA/YrhL
MTIPHTDPGGRVYGLDIMRAVAILSVVQMHGYVYLSANVPRQPYFLPATDGVTLFFVLSGYLIGGIILKLLAQPAFGVHEAGAFWLRRWLRTLPSYYLVLALLFGTALLGLQGPPPRLRHYLFFVQNLAWPHPGFFGEAWSLAIEEWFYLLLPVALLLLVPWVRRERRQALLLGWALALIIAVTVYRFQSVPAHSYAIPHEWDDWIRKTVVCRLDAIGYGVVGAWIRFKHPERWRRYPKSLLCAGLALLAFHQVDWVLLGNVFYFNYLALTMTPLAALMLLPALSAMRTGAGRVYRFFTFISAISYPMYLVNLGLVQVSLMPWMFGPQVRSPAALLPAIGAYLAFWALTIGLAALIHRYFEKPIMDWRDHRVRGSLALAAN